MHRGQLLFYLPSVWEQILLSVIALLCYQMCPQTEWNRQYSSKNVDQNLIPHARRWKGISLCCVRCTLCSHIFKTEIANICHFSCSESEFCISIRMWIMKTTMTTGVEHAQPKTELEEKGETFSLEFSLAVIVRRKNSIVCEQQKCESFDSIWYRNKRNSRNETDNKKPKPFSHCIFLCFSTIQTFKRSSWLMFPFVCYTSQSVSQPIEYLNLNCVTCPASHTHTQTNTRTRSLRKNRLDKWALCSITIIESSRSLAHIGA